MRHTGLVSESDGQKVPEEQLLTRMQLSTGLASLILLEGSKDFKSKEMKHLD